MKVFKKFLKERGLELNAEKSKIMRFRRAGGRWKEEIFKWGDKDIEIVKSFIYLGYKLKSNGGNEDHIRYITDKARTVMGRILSYAERKLKDSWRLRMLLFDSLISGIITYGAEIWGWKGFTEIERIQDRYIKWTLRLDRNTPRYLIAKATGRDYIKVRTSKRAMRFEEKLKDNESRLLRKCWENRRKEDLSREEEFIYKLSREKREFLNGLGWSVEEYLSKLDRESSVWEEALRREKDIARQKIESEVRESTYAREVRELLERETGNDHRIGYLEIRGGLQVVERFRLGNEARANRYWMKTEERRCRLCKKEEETMKHIFERCEYTKREKSSWMDYMRGTKLDLKNMMEIIWIRKRHSELERREEIDTER